MSDLHRFGIEPGLPPDERQWANVCKLLTSIITNPHLLIGDESSRVLFPEPLLPRGRSSAGPEVCPFGQITRWKETIGGTPVTKTGIRGGLIFTGISTWNVDPYEINLAVDGTWLVYLSASVEVNRDDDNEILLPGVKVGNSAPTWNKTSAENYPNGTAPVVSTGNGIAILPVGQLTVTDGRPVLVPTGCGSFQVDHCSGTLTVGRW